MNLLMQEKYNIWLEKSKLYPEIYEDLLKIKNNSLEIYNRFSCDLTFGTAGARGLVGAGPNRINTLVVARISQALAEQLLENFKNPSVVIAYDTRINSFSFAKTVANVLSSNGILAYIFKNESPTPLLSFAVRRLKCSAGVVITASHNSCEYNGYKIYSSDGAQICDTTKIYEKIKMMNIFDNIKIFDFKKSIENKNIVYVNQNLVEDYVDFVLTSCESTFKNLDINVTYSPLNGCASKIVCDIAKKLKIEKFNIVKSQQYPDGNFTTCPNPNPEKPEAFFCAINEAYKLKSDLIILNDPDGDRIGLAVFHENKYEILNGNIIAILILYFLLIKRKNNNKNIVFKSIVSGGLFDELAKDFKLNIIETLPGFKYIGKGILELEKEKKVDEFLFAYEESHGYLYSTEVRDKDGIAAMVIICNMANYFKKQNMTLIDIFYKLEKKYGFFSNKTLAVQLKNIENSKDFINAFKKSFFEQFKDLEKYYDFKESIFYNLNLGIKEKLLFPKSEIFSFITKNNKQKLIIRQSGTEPIIKFYITSRGENSLESKQNLNKIQNFIDDFDKKYSF